MSGERGPRLLRVVAATALALIGPAAASAAAADTTPGPAPAPGLSVVVLGGGTPADEHSAIDYTIELRDDGPTPYRHLAVSAVLPAGFRVLHAAPAADPAAAVPTWTTDLAPGQRLDIRARIAAGTVQDLAEGSPIAAASAASLAAGPADATAPGAQAWYSLTACARGATADGPPVTCGLSTQLLVKTDDDTREGVAAIVLLLGLPAVVAGLGAYAWRARRDPEVGS